MKQELVKLYKEFLEALGEYENDRYRKMHNPFWDRSEHETFEGFIRWLEVGIA